MKSAVDDLIQARVFQNTVLNKIRGEQADIIYQQRNVAAGICFELGEYHNEQRAHEKAMTFYNEALKQVQSFVHPPHYRRTRAHTSIGFLSSISRALSHTHTHVEREREREREREAPTSHTRTHAELGGPDLFRDSQHQ